MPGRAQLLHDVFLVTGISTPKVGPGSALESWSRVGTRHSTVLTTPEISMPTGASPAWRTPSPPLNSWPDRWHQPPTDFSSTGISMTTGASMPTGASPARRTPSPPLKSGTPLAPHRHERTQFNVRSCWRCLQHEPCSLDVLSSAPIALAETKPAAQTHSNSASNLLPPPGKQSRHPDQLALAPGNEPNSASLIPACLPVPAQ